MKYPRFSVYYLKLALPAILSLLIVSAVFLSFSEKGGGIYAYSHTVFKTRWNYTSGYIAFCAKCHSKQSYLVNISAHYNTTCICHGYKPSGTFKVNLRHNLTTSPYCTRCHSTTEYVSSLSTGLNQSCHYVTKNKTKLYRNIADYFVVNLTTGYPKYENGP